MPYLGGGIPVLDEDDNNQPILNGFEESRTLAFRSLDGANLISFVGDEYIARVGVTGIEVPPRELVEQESQGEDGAQLDEIKVLARTWSVPLRIGSNSGHRDFLTKRSAVRALLNHRSVDYQAHGGTFDLVANSVLGERALRSTYLSGWEGDWQQATAGSYFETVPIVGRSVRPYWTSERWTTPPIMRPTGFSWFGSWPPVLSPSRTLGADITVSVDGDASSWPKIEVGGYAPSVEISGPGLYVVVPDGLADGETFTLDTYPPNRFPLFNGQLDWGRLGWQRRWAPMAPGDNLFNIDLGVAGGKAWAVVSGPTLWETPW